MIDASSMINDNNTYEYFVYFTRYILPWLICLVAYIIGSIPFGLILVRLSGMGDVREIGSGNIGATNVMRTGKKSIGILTLLLDAGKGAAVIGIAYWLDVSPYIAGACAILGHIFPVWLKFRGGKGVATYLGVLLAINWIMGLVFITTWLTTFFATKISSLSAIFSLFIVPLIGFFVVGSYFFAFASVVGILVIFKHKDNIKRLINKEE